MSGLRPDDVEPGPLAGIHALDLTQGAAGPISMSYLAMLGAEVIKIEPPGGDFSRHTKPLQDGMGTTFMGNNLCKFGVMLDLKTEEDLQVAKDLIKVTDIVLDNYRSPKVLEKLGIGYEVMRELNPQIIYVQSSAWGQSKTFAEMFSHEWIAQAPCGLVATTGMKGGQGEFTKGIAHCDWFAALVNIQAVLIALQQRAITGASLMVETCQYASSICAGFTHMVDYLASGNVPQPLGNQKRNVVPELVLKTLDGAVAISAPTTGTWQRLCRITGLENHFAEMNVEQRIQAREHIAAALQSAFDKKTSDEWCKVLSEAQVPYAPVDTRHRLSEIVASHPQVGAAEIVKTMESTRGELLVSNPPWSFSRTPASIWKAFPELGEHQSEVLRLASIGDRERATRVIAEPATSADGTLPLRGIRVLDCSQGIIGAFATMQFGSLGAVVTKVEPPEGDWLRGIPPFVDGRGALFEASNRNKTGIALDPNNAEDVSTLRRLLSETDIVVTSDRDQRLWPQLDYAYWESENPAIIWGEISAFGPAGPLSGQPATELTIQMATGLNRHFGSADADPIREGFDFASMATSLYLQSGLLAALFGRRSTGRGQKVGVSMLASMVAMLEWNLVAEHRPDEQIGLTLEAYAAPPLYGIVLKDKVVNIDFRGDGQAWDLFFIAIDRAELCSNEMFNGSAAILRNKVPLLEELAPTLRQWSYDDLASIVRGVEGAIAPVMGCDEALHFAESDGLFNGLAGDLIDKIGRPWRFSGLHLPAGRPFESEINTGQ